MPKSLSMCACKVRFALLIGVLCFSPFISGCSTSTSEKSDRTKSDQPAANRATSADAPIASVNPRDLFYQELKDPQAEAKALSLAYAIELNRPGCQPRLVTNKEEFVSGDSIRLRVKSNMAYYLYIKCKQGSTGEIASLYPPIGGEDNRLEPGQECLIPKKGLITFDNKPGSETLMLILSRERLEERDLHLQPDQPNNVATIVPSTLTGHPEQVGNTTVLGNDNNQDPFVYVRNSDSNNLRLNFELTHAGKSGDGDQPVTAKWAVLVGIDKFAHIQGASTGCTGDVKNMSAFLTKEAGFQPDHVITLTDSGATKQNIMRTLADLSPRIKQGDLVLLSFSSHGTDKTDSGENYIVTYDFDWNDVGGTGIRMQDLSSQIKSNIRSERIVVLVDTCHSANSRKLTRPEDDLRGLLTGRGHIIVSSCLPDEEALPIVDSNNAPVAGLFTTCLIKGWRKDHMLKVAFQNAGQETAAEAQKKGHNQHPACYSQWRGPDVDIYSAPAN